MHLPVIEHTCTLDLLNGLAHVGLPFPKTAASSHDDAIATGFGQPVEEYESRVWLNRKPEVGRLNEIAGGQPPDLSRHRDHVGPPADMLNH